MIKKILFLLILGVFGSIKAQDTTLFDSIRNEYESFNYEKVILMANNALLDTSTFNKNELIEIYLMKSVSHFTLNEEDSVRKSFIEILKINPEYSLDPLSVSPKIVTLYEKVKDDFNQIVGPKPEPEISENTLPGSITVLTDTIFVDKYRGLPAWSYFKSALVPGWGHIDNGDEVKGFILTGVSVFLAGSAIYYTLETNDREKDYLNAEGSSEIRETYNSYNKAYQMRNGLIIGYLGVWLYSQLDLMFINNDVRIGDNLNSAKIDIPSDLKLSLSISF